LFAGTTFFKTPKVIPATDITIVSFGLRVKKEQKRLRAEREKEAKSKRE